MNDEITLEIKKRRTFAIISKACETRPSLPLQIAGSRRERFLPSRTKGKIDFRAMGLTRHIDQYPVWNPF